MLKSMIYQETGSIYRDSRDVLLKPGDLVLVMYTENFVQFNVYTIVQDNRQRQALFSLSDEPIHFGYKKKLWVLKLNITRDNYLSYLENIRNKLLFNGLLETKLGTLSTYAYILEENFKSSNNVRSLSRFGIRDCLDRKLNAGSLVLYSGGKEFSKDANTWSYGIVVSDKKVFTEHLTYVNPHHVILLEEYTKEERELYREIIRQFKQQAMTSSNIKGFKIGDIYRLESGNVYLYLGPCELVWKKKQNCSLMIDYMQDTKEGRWLNLGKTDVYSIERMVSDRYYMNDRFEKIVRDIKLERRKYQITEDLYAGYQAVVDFPSLLYKLPSEGNFVANVQLYSEYKLNRGLQKTNIHMFDIKLVLHGDI